MFQKKTVLISFAALLISATATMLYTSGALAREDSSKKGSRILPLDAMMEATDFPADLKEKAKKDLHDLNTRGYADATEEQVSILESYKKPEYQGELRPIGSVLATLTFKPANLENTPFSKLKDEGARGVGTNIDGKWTALDRVFTTKSGEIIEFSELDFTLGGGVDMPQEYINENINGNPASLGISQAPSGKAMTELTWFAESKAYTLRTTENVKKNRKLQEFLDLANSI